MLVFHYMCVDCLQIIPFKKVEFGIGFRFLDHSEFSSSRFSQRFFLFMWCRSCIWFLVHPVTILYRFNINGVIIGFHHLDWKRSYFWNISCSCRWMSHVKGEICRRMVLRCCSCYRVDEFPTYIRTVRRWRLWRDVSGGEVLKTEYKKKGKQVKK